MPSYKQRQENIVASVAACAVGATVNATAGNALNAVIGNLILPTVGYASVAAAAGSLAAVAAAAATGGAILLIPHCFLAGVIANNLAHKPNLHFCLQTALTITTAVCTGLLGAAILGMAVNPVGACVLAGMMTASLGIFALGTLCSILGCCVAHYFSKNKNHTDAPTPSGTFSPAPSGTFSPTPSGTFSPSALFLAKKLLAKNRGKSINACEQACEVLALTCS